MTKYKTVPEPVSYDKDGKPWSERELAQMVDEAIMVFSEEDDMQNSVHVIALCLAYFVRRYEHEKTEFRL